MIIAFSLISGLVILMLGSEILIRNAVTAAYKMGISHLVVGVVLIGFGTSVPELITCLEAAFAGAPDIATGNVVGSNIANLLLILGVAAFLNAFKCESPTLTRDHLFLFFSFLIIVPFVFIPEIPRSIGIIMLFVLCYYGYRTLRTEKKIHPEEDIHEKVRPIKQLIPPILLSFLGIGLTILGAKILVYGAIELATHFGISEAIIGLTIIAVGTSLPELATAITASLKGHSDLVFGNVIGSNIYNVFGVLGATTLVNPLSIPQQIAHFDLWVMGVATLMTIYFTRKHRTVTRMMGFGAIILYGSYLGILGTRAF